MSKTIETDTRTFVKFWLVPLGIGLVILFLYKAFAGLIIIGISIFLALALKPLVRKVNGLFTKLFGTEKKHQTASAVLAYLIVVLVIGGIIAAIFGDSAGGSGGGGRSDDNDHWHGTGNPYV